MNRPLRLLAVDDERPALDELAYLLGRDERVGEVVTTQSATEALVLLQGGDFDGAFLDIEMPGLSGLELAQVLARFRTPPSVVFVTAHEAHAVDAFEVRAVDYVLKPVGDDRLARALDRIVTEAAAPSPPTEQRIPVERGGVTRFVRRADVTHAEANGDYVRLHTADGPFLLRVPLGQLETEWQSDGFVRIHRSSLVSLAHVVELRVEAGRCTVRLSDGSELDVSRRQTRELRDLYLRRGGAAK